MSDILNCPDLYGSYKSLCDNMAHAARWIYELNVDAMLLAQLDDVLVKVAGLGHLAKTCKEQRIEYKERCVNPSKWDKGHDDFIKDARQCEYFAAMVIDEIKTRIKFSRAPPAPVKTVGHFIFKKNL